MNYITIANEAIEEFWRRVQTGVTRQKVCLEFKEKYKLTETQFEVISFLVYETDDIHQRLAR